MDAARRAGLTKARRAGLWALAAAPAQCARRTNATSVVLAHVYWQTADWLVARGYAVEAPGRQLIHLTSKGAELAIATGVLRAAGRES